MIKIKNISKIYNKGERSQVDALADISLEINKGEFVALMGPSGSGKSTLMYMIGCLDKPSKGEYYLENENIANLKDKKLAKIRNQKVGFVFQTFNLLPRVKVIDNILLPLQYSGRKRNRFKIAKKIIDELGLSERINHHPNELSGGEKQRVAIARALINDAQIILADEPTGNLDSKSGQKILEILKKLNKKGRTIILVTHNKEIASAAERIINIKDGKIVG